MWTLKLMLIHWIKCCTAVIEAVIKSSVGQSNRTEYLSKSTSK